MTSVREAVRGDVPAVHDLIRELAAYEREPDAVVATAGDLERALFDDDGGPAVAHCLVAESGGEVVGIALWFVNFSTWRGKPGMYLEDLFVRPNARRSGTARALMDQLREIAGQRGYDRIDWSVLDWNADAHAFYRSLGAEPMADWTTWRLRLHD